MARTTNTISKEAYLDLIELANIDENICDEIDEDGGFYRSSSWEASENDGERKLAYFRSRKKEIEERRVADIFHSKREEIIALIRKYTNFKIGEFEANLYMIGNIGDDEKLTDDIMFDVSIKQKKTRTPGGFPCNMSYGMNFAKDNRFKHYPWVKLFDSNGEASRVPLSEAITIIKYLQFTQRFSAFT